MLTPSGDMQKIIYRIISMVLVTCLIENPALALVKSNSPTAISIVPDFMAQAVNPEITFAEHALSQVPPARESASTLAHQTLGNETVGLVFGKFAPFHNGHEMVIREALNQCDRVIVLLYDHPELTDIPAEEMADLIRRVIPDPRLSVKVAYHAPPSGDMLGARKAHMKFMREQLPEGIQINKIFNNEWYGADIATEFAAELIRVDPNRTQHPISATAIRQDPVAHQHNLHPLVYERVRRARMVAHPPELRPFLTPIDDLTLAAFSHFEPKRTVWRRLLQLNPRFTSLKKLLATTYWNTARYAERNLPSVVGEIEDKEAFSQQRGLRIQDMLILSPEEGRRPPEVVRPFLELFHKAEEVERAVNPDFEKGGYYGYVTVDQKIVLPNTAQRRQGHHADAYVKASNTVLGTSQKVLTTNTYIAYDSLPTEFIEGPLPLGAIDPEDDREVLRYFDEQAALQKPVTFLPYKILRLTPYDVHSPVVNDTDSPQVRTFVKITFSKEKYNRMGNTRNPLFSYHNWRWVAQDPQFRTHRNTILEWDRPDKDQFRLIDPASIDISQNHTNVPWAKPAFFWAKKIEGVHAERALPEEVVETVVGGFAVTLNISQPGDWKITTSRGDQYFLSDAKFRERYDTNTAEGNYYLPRSIPTQMLELSEPVRLKSPWGTMQYVPAGSVLAFLGKNDIYAIHRDNVRASYVRLEPTPSVERLDMQHLEDPLTPEEAEKLKSQIRRLNPQQPEDRLFAVQEWDIKEFEKPHLPVVIGPVNPEEFSRYNPEQRIRDLDLLIYAPGQGWAVPKRLEQFREAIELAVQAEKLANPECAQRFVHITVDQKMVQPDKPGRRPGLHTDAGLTDDQGRQLDVTAENREAISQRRGKSDHAYVIHDALPTAFYPGPFPLTPRPHGHTQTFEETARKQTPVYYENHMLLRLNAYDIHEAVINDTGHPVQRTFVKIQFTERLLDRDINTMNPELNYKMAQELSRQKDAGQITKGTSLRIATHYDWGQEFARHNWTSFLAATIAGVIASPWLLLAFPQLSIPEALLLSVQIFHTILHTFFYATQDLSLYPPAFFERTA